MTFQRSQEQILTISQTPAVWELFIFESIFHSIVQSRVPYCLTRPLTQTLDRLGYFSITMSRFELRVHFHIASSINSKCSLDNIVARPWCCLPVSDGDTQVAPPWCCLPVSNGDTQVAPPWCCLPVSDGDTQVAPPWCCLPVSNGDTQVAPFQQKVQQLS